MRFLIAFWILTLPLTVVAQEEDPLACVDPLVRETLIGHQGQPQVYSYQIPARFPPLPLSEHLSIIGSVVNPSYTQASLLSELSQMDTRNEFVDLMESSGWRTMSGGHRAYEHGGFVRKTSVEIQNPQMFCHDDYGNLNAYFRLRNDGGSYINLSWQPDASRTVCNQRYNQRMHQILSLPLLELPDDVSPRVHGGGSGGSNDEAHAETEFRSVLKLGEVESHFSRQLLNQSWNKETDWVANGSAGSAWISPNEDRALMLWIVPKKGRYKVEMRGILR